MERQGFERLVEGEGVHVPVEMLALGNELETGRELLVRGVDVALCRLLCQLELLTAQGLLEVEIAGEVEEVTLFGCHQGEVLYQFS